MSQSFGKRLFIRNVSSKVSSQTRSNNIFTGRVGAIFSPVLPSHLVELPQVLLLCLVDDGQDSGDGLADNTTERNRRSFLMS